MPSSSEEETDSEEETESESDDEDIRIPGQARPGQARPPAGPSAPAAAASFK